MKQFKTTFAVVLAAVLILGCSLLNFGGKFSPPDWILGTWADSLGTTEYTFETDNVTQTIAGYGINLGLAYIAATVTETSNDSLYEFSITQSESTASYLFEKTSATTLDYTITASSTTSPVMKLTKQ